MYAQSEIAEQVFEAIQNGGSWSGEVELKTKNGGIVPTLLRSDCIVDDSGKRIGLIAVCTDISERKQKKSTATANRAGATSGGDSPTHPPVFETRGDS